MILIDTNRWISHFKHADSEVIALLQTDKIVTHDFILGELTLGQFTKANRSLILERMNFLRKLPTSSHEEVTAFIEKYQMMGSGVGWVDAHLLHSCWKSKISLLTNDKNLNRLARKLQLLP